MIFGFRLQAKFGNARVGELATPHGIIKTPMFMPVGTQGSVKSLTPDDLKALGAEIILGNTYHLYLRPGDEVVKEMGQLHRFARWDKPILTDSGGYQVSSMGHFQEGRDSRRNINLKPTVIDEDGVKFWSHLDGSEHYLTPEKSIMIQENLGADIIMAFDEATPDRGRNYAREAMERTHRWLVRSKTQWEKMEEAKASKAKSEVGCLPQALFGIIQGGDYKDLRLESAEFVAKMNLPGVAIGGGSIGIDHVKTEENMSWIRSLLPQDKPRYTMGVGTCPGDVVAVVMSGADMFDCVAPTRLARMGGLYSGKMKVGAELEFVSEFEKQRLNIDNKRFEKDKGVIDSDCDCYTCRQGFSRAYLHHLFRARELVYYRLASIHNLRMMIRAVEQTRDWVLEQGTQEKY